MATYLSETINSPKQAVFFGTDKTTGKEGEKVFNYGFHEDELRYEPGQEQTRGGAPGGL